LIALPRLGFNSPPNRAAHRGVFNFNRRKAPLSGASASDGLRQTDLRGAARLLN
jgi:hypothetical protein